MASFYEDVLMKSPVRLNPALNRDLALIEPETLKRAQAIIKGAAMQGIHLAIYEGYRSPARQEQMVRNGVSQVHTGTHEYGLAVDLVKQVIATRRVRAICAAERMIWGYPADHGAFANEALTLIWSWAGSYDFMVPLAKANGMVSGIDWGVPGAHHTLIDGAHVQRVRVADQGKLFTNAWYPDEAYNPNP
jgi:hypothetical protein